MKIGTREPPLTVPQASEYTGIPEATLRWMRFQNEGPRSYTIGRRRVVYDRADLDLYLDTRRAETSRGGDDGGRAA